MRYEFANCVLDVDRHVLLRGGETVPVEPQVFDLLELLAEHPGKLVARDDIIDRVWNGRLVSESTISARVAAARKAVGDDGKNQSIIRTIVRRGLQLTAEVTSDARKQPCENRKTQQLRYARSRDGRALPFAISGNGPPVLRIGSVVQDLEASMRLPSERTYMNAMDTAFTMLRSDKVCESRLTDPSNIDFDGIAEDILAVTEAAGFDRFAVISEHGGILSALPFVTRYPEKVSRFAIVGGWAEGRAHREAVSEPDSIRTLIAEGWRDKGGGYALSTLLTYYPDGPLETVRQIVDELQSLYSVEQKLHHRDAGNNVSHLHFLPKVQCPTLILHGRDATVHPMSQARKLAAGIPDASLVVLETANHIPLPGNDAYDTYIRTLQDFLSEAD